MINTLGKRFFAITIALVFAVVAVMSSIMARLGVGKVESSYEAAFANAVSSVADKIRMDMSVSDEWLARAELANDLIIGISENGIPMSFSGSLAHGTERSKLMELCIEQAASLGFSPNPKQVGSENDSAVDFTLRGVSGDSYRARVQLVKTGEGSFAVVTVLMDLRGQSEDISRLLFNYAAVVVVSMAALFVVSLLLTRLAVKPAKESIEKQNEFISAAGHELRSPLAVIKAELSLAAEAGNHADMLAVIERETERLTKLTDDLLALSKGGTGTWGATKEETELEPLLMETAEAFIPIAGKTGHSLNLLLPDSILPRIKTDRVRLRQIIDILVDNACEHTPPGTEIEITASVERAHVMLCVSDNGSGIPDSEKRRVFERFYRIDQSRTDKKHFGLGLSIACEYAKLLDGTLSLSDMDGGGASFTLRLPRR